MKVPGTYDREERERVQLLGARGPPDYRAREIEKRWQGTEERAPFPHSLCAPEKMSFCLSEGVVTVLIRKITGCFCF